MFGIHEYLGDGGTPLRYGRLSREDEAADGKPALLYIPGLGGPVKASLGFLERLLEAYDPIYGVDLRAFGLNGTGEPPNFETKTLLADLNAFQNQVLKDIPSPAKPLALGGISMGAALATMLCAARPESYESLFLLAPAYRGSPLAFTPLYRLRAHMAKLLHGAEHRRPLPYGLESLTRNRAILDDPQFQQMPRLMVDARDLALMKELCDAAMGQTAQIRTRTLMVIPGNDSVCDPQAMRRGFLRIPAETSKVCKEFPDLFHDVLMEAEMPEIAETIVQWTRSGALSPAERR